MSQAFEQYEYTDVCNVASACKIVPTTDDVDIAFSNGASLLEHNGVFQL